MKDPEFNDVYESEPEDVPRAVDNKQDDFEETD